MYILSAKIEIGNYIFNSINEVEITKTVEELVDTAIIKMPLRFKVRDNNEQKFTEEVIKVGDPVKITLAYEGKYEGVEFEGYVARVKTKIPLEIHCEDAMWILRRKNITKAFGKTTMKEILEEVVKDTPIKLSKRIPSVALEKYIIKDANGTQVLQGLKENLAMTVFLEDDGSLYCGLQQATNIGQIVIYDLNYNLVENNLEFKTSEDKRIKVKYTYIDNKNQRKSYEFGDKDGELRTYHTSVVSDEKKLEEMAKAEIKKLKYDGFEGDVTSFLIPYVTRGMAAEIRDIEHKNREGNYFIKSVITTFGTNGARRKATLSNKL
ncbi:late control protein [Chryseobacterium herbae]|uniref:Late control protein n=1 Tax=Chryseobacterium herbae TaxID=2976476 RepID=A0ABT2IYN2_9FLAO|nr:late control protein [Chryseobacterium sp. pc1-10]MCT2563946.1 late control protein [Chryseobacterium sp. pc1-10]